MSLRLILKAHFTSLLALLSLYHFHKEFLFSDDEDVGNPMVSKFDEEVDFDDYESVASSKVQNQENYESL